MYKKKLTFTTFSGRETTKTFYFNLTEAEVLRMEATTEGGMKNYLERIIDSKSPKEMIEYFEKIMDASYGEISEDGDNFVKSPEILAKFKSSQAYSDLYVLFSTDDEAAAEFINGVLPEKYVKAAVDAKKNKDD